MQTSIAKHWTLELEAERKLLRKAETDIEKGWSRLRNQEELLTHIRACGSDNPEAEWLVHAMRRTLVEWERHRNLIEHRIDHLEKVAAAEARS